MVFCYSSRIRLRYFFINVYVVIDGKRDNKLKNLILLIDYVFKRKLSIWVIFSNFFRKLEDGSFFD